MRNINLLDSYNSEVKYELTTFPDGEPHIKFLEDIDRKDSYNVVCRITNPTELFVVMQVGHILKRHPARDQRRRLSLRVKGFLLDAVYLDWLRPPRRFLADQLVKHRLPGWRLTRLRQHPAKRNQVCLGRG